MIAVLRRLALVVLVVAGLVLAGGVAVATGSPRLSTAGPTSVTGTGGTSVFEVGDRVVRAVQYEDRQTLVYTFTLVNHGSFPVTVTGIETPHPDPYLFDYERLVDEDGDTRFTVGGGEERRVSLELLMTACETLSARAGSFATDVVVRTTDAVSLTEATVTLALPEEIRAGSPREARCANATASSRSPG